jgi:hypothetical protein
LLASSTPFGFSLPQEWDTFYQERRQYQNGAIIHASSNPAEVEWQDSIPLIDIANAVPPDSTLLMVLGCGTSRLPQVLLEPPSKNAPKHMVLLDTSRPASISCGICMGWSHALAE